MIKERTKDRWSVGQHQQETEIRSKADKTMENRTIFENISFKREAILFRGKRKIYVNER